ncbi:unnamed protein product [Rangifer tarandus platyrhynchus]|uniref:Uncharacterized protein n=1 Tax=Rangifer tarandus platyrhynchus TaxID=3082113 RepID=A0ABN8YSI6_RANTA|nr:unnamed protein product [Rangifer tarandus platyrhynchus]
MADEGGHPIHPPMGGVRAPPPCPGGPVQAPGECAHGGVSPTGNEEEAGKACCPDTTRDTPRGPVSACHGAQHTRLRPRAPEPLPLRQREDLERSTAEHRALLLAFNRAPLPRPVPTEVVATRAGSPAPGSDVPPPQQARPPPRAHAPALALAREPESGHELPPLQGEPALAPAQDPDAHDD